MQIIHVEANAFRQFCMDYFFDHDIGGRRNLQLLRQPRPLWQRPELQQVAQHRQDRAPEVGSEASESWLVEWNVNVVASVGREAEERYLLDLNT